MDKEYIRRHLPEDPPEGLLSWARLHDPDMGEEYMIFLGERVREQPTMSDLFENIAYGKKVWATRCKCTACQEDFVTQKVKGSDSFLMVEGEDGNLYTCFYEAEPGTTIEIGEGDRMTCPVCDEECRVISAKSLKGGRLRQTKISTLQNVDGYTAVIYYLVQKRVDANGCWYDIEPDRAAVITEYGGLVFYSHRITTYFGNNEWAGRWELAGSRTNPEDLVYHDWGSTLNRKRGCIVYNENLPNMDGTTGEKTGLLSWFRTGCAYPLDYFRLWKNHKNLEHIVNAGGCRLIEYSILHSSCQVADLMGYVDFSKAKPSQMLGISKKTMGELQSKKRLTRDWLLPWNSYRRMGGKMQEQEFFILMEQVGLTPMSTAMELMKTYGDDPKKIFSYLKKQGELRAVGLLRDARRFALQLGNDEDGLTQEELWPRHLRETHDRLDEQLRIRRNQIKANHYQQGFDDVLETYSGLQWNDGVLAVILPKCNEDLVREGKVLRHCVGGYGEEHSQGESIIFFVRHYRRPERSYYTLNVSFRGKVPHEVQLHGYGNERHGEYKQYSHKIPQKVRDFVDTWEKTVLLPWWKEQNKQKRSRTA